jgi:transcriptional regulator with XRE-family HTH domain
MELWDRMDRDELGKKINALRAAKGLSLEALAGDSKINKNTINQIEQGRGNPTIGTLEALADILGEPLIQLHEPSSPMSPAAQSILQTIWASWPKAPPEVRALCLYVLTDHVEYVSLLPKDQRAKVLGAARALGLNAPKEIS